MKKISIVLFLIGVIYIIGCIIYYRSVVNPVDSDAMRIDRGGNEVAMWPIFIGIIFAFVGATFFYASLTERKNGGRRID